VGADVGGVFVATTGALFVGADVVLTAEGIAVVLVGEGA